MVLEQRRYRQVDLVSCGSIGFGFPVSCSLRIRGVFFQSGLHKRVASVFRERDSLKATYLEGYGLSLPAFLVAVQDWRSSRFQGQIHFYCAQVGENRGYRLRGAINYD